jgi:ADP-ribosylglycohydrolase
MHLEERVRGCFQGLAIGDAIGKQTETLTRAGVRQWYPQGVAGFEGRPGEVIPRYAGKRYEWLIGETTDDTEQTIAVARALLREREVRRKAIGAELLQCRKSVHPGVSMWTFQQIGDPARVASEGDGCGAAMRVSPIGVILRSTRLDDIVRAAHACSLPTHGGALALDAAAAVAGAVSAALDGRPAEEVLGGAIAAAGQSSAIAHSIRRIHSDLAARGNLDVEEVARDYFPDRPQTIVPLAIGLALVTKSAEKTALNAANLGGDSDSVASIGGAIAGALYPETVNREWCDVVELVNGHGLRDLAAALAALRIMDSITCRNL